MGAAWILDRGTQKSPTGKNALIQKGHMGLWGGRTELLILSPADRPWAWACIRQCPPRTARRTAAKVITDLGKEKILSRVLIFLRLSKGTSLRGESPINHEISLHSQSVRFCLCTSSLNFSLILLSLVVSIIAQRSLNDESPLKFLSFGNTTCRHLLEWKVVLEVVRTER